jgi:outer membrane lipoprotein carrier protein
MKKFTLLLLVILLLPVTASAMTAAELADRLQESYDRTHDLRADFTQVSVIKAMRMQKEGKGVLIIKKPGLLRYTYTKPDRQEIIVKGEELVMYSPESKQVIKKTLARAVMDKTPSTFLAGLGKITDSFDVRTPKTGEKNKQGHYQIELVPKGDKMGVEDITLELDPENYNILKFSFTDVSGNTNSISLTNIKINKGIKESAFNFQIPKGATLIAE